MALPASLVGGISWQITDGNGTPQAGAKMFAYETGNAPTAKAIYADANRDTQLSQPAIADSDGRLVFFVDPGGYDFTFFDADDAALYTISEYEDVGATFLGQLGVELAQPVATTRTSGYTIVTTDTLVIIDGTGGPDPCVINFSTVADHPLPVTTKNIGNVQVELRPNGTETAENVNGYFYLPAASGATLPSALWVNDAVSAWWILGSHGL